MHNKWNSSEKEYKEVIREGFKKEVTWICSGMTNNIQVPKKDGGKDILMETHHKQKRGDVNVYSMCLGQKVVNQSMQGFREGWIN